MWCRRRLALPVGLSVLSATAGAAPPLSPQPDRLLIVAPASKGGGWDQTAHAMARALMEGGLARGVEVRNSPGAGGAIGLAQFLSSERGREDALLVGGLVMVSALRVTGATVALSQATPVARLTGEYEVIAVPAASELRSLDELVQALRLNPGAVAWGGGSPGGIDQLLITELARAIEVPPVRLSYVPFSGGGEVAAALLEGQVSVGVSGYAEFAEHLANGRLRALAISSEARRPGIDVPTLREQGVDVTLLNWRGVFAPPGIAPAARDRLAEMVAAMVATPAWKGAIRRHRWDDLYLEGAAFESYLREEEARTARARDPRGTGPAAGPGAVWTTTMRLLRNRTMFVTTLAVVLVVVGAGVAIQVMLARRREHALAQRLEAAQQESLQRRAEARQLLDGVGAQIERQLTAWGLTSAEREVAMLMLKGLRHKEIAALRGTSERTVRQQALTIYKKAGLDGRTDLAAFFLEDLLAPPMAKDGKAVS